MKKSILDKLKESKEPLVKASISDVDDYKKITEKSKKTLEAILRFKVCEIRYLDNKNKEHTNIVTSNTQIIKLFSFKHGTNDKKNLKKIANMGSTGIHSRDSFYVLSWDLEKNDFIRIPSNRWNINICKNITINEENIEILNTVLKDILEHNK